MGLEPSAEGRGEPGQRAGVVGRIARDGRGAVEVQRPIDLGLAEAEFRGPGGVAVGEGQRRQPVEHRGVRRVGRGEPLPGRALAGAVAPPGRPPGVQGEPLVGRQPDGPERRRGRLGLVVAVGGQRPSEPRPVDRDVGRPCPAGVVQGAAGVVEPALAGREVRPGEGHPAVARCQSGGAVEHRAQAGQGRGVEVDDDVSPGARPSPRRAGCRPGHATAVGGGPEPRRTALAARTGESSADGHRPPWVRPGSPRGRRSAPARPR